MRRATLASLLLAFVGSCVVTAYDGERQQPAGQPQTPAPIPASGQALAASDDFVKRRAWYERNFQAGYLRAGRHDARWDTQAEEFIRLSADFFLGGATDDSGDRLGRARTLVATGCDDPVVLYLAGLTLSFDDRDSRQASELFERAYVGIPQSGYSRGTARFVATGLRRDLERRNEGMGRRHALDPVELRLFLEALRDGSYAPDDDLVLVTHLISGGGASLFVRNRAAIVGAVEQTPWVDPWARLFLSGGRRVDDAWDARGHEFADKVKPEGWKGFSESLALARTDLEASWRARPDRPEAAVSMVEVTMAGGAAPGETPRLWFDRAVAARLDWMGAYNNLITSLRSRWGGEEGELLAFARECAATRRFDTEVPFQAVNAIEWLESDTWFEAKGEAEWPLHPYQRARSPYATDDVYTLVEAVLERYRREPARQLEWRRFASLQAAIAYKAGKYERARELLHQLGGTLEGAGRDAMHEDTAEGRIEAYATPEGAEVRRAERLFLEGHGKQARPIFEKARAKAPVAARPLLDKRLAAIALETGLAAGRSARLLPDQELHGWSVENGQWVVEADGSLLGTSGSRGLLIVADARVGPSFELESDVEIVSTSNGQFQAGILFGHRPTFNSASWESFRLKKTAHEGEVAYFSRNFNKPSQSVPRKVAPKSHVVIQSWDGRLWAYVDGEPVVAGYRPEWGMPTGADVQVGFGAYTDDNTYQVRYRGARLRRLTAAPTPPKTRR